MADVPFGAATGLVVQPAHWDMGYHQHLDVEVSAVLAGQGTFHWEDDVFSISEGHVVLIASSIPHRYTAQTPIRFAVIQARRLSLVAATSFRSLLGDNKVRVVRLAPEDLMMYESLFRNWLRIASRTSRQGSTLLETWFCLFLEFLRAQSAASSPALTNSNAAAHIRDNLAENISVNDMAKRAGLSESAFRRSFRRDFGVSPKQYQQQVRLEEAKWLLRSSDKPIAQIAEATGFSAIHAFSTWFQRSVGVPPTVWRSQQQLGNPD